MGLARLPRYAGAESVSAVPAVALTRDRVAVWDLFTGRFKDRISYDAMYRAVLANDSFQPLRIQRTEPLVPVASQSGKPIHAEICGS